MNVEASLRSKATGRPLLKINFQVALLLNEASALVNLNSPLLQVAGTSKMHEPLDCHHFKQYGPARSAGSFVGIIVDNPTQPGQIERLFVEPLTHNQMCSVRRHEFNESPLRTPDKDFLYFRLNWSWEF